VIRVEDSDITQPVREPASPDQGVGCKEAGKRERGGVSKRANS